MIRLPEHVRNNLPTAQEVMAHLLLCCLLWGFVGLLLMECLP